jgi:hypothetical protein
MDDISHWQRFVEHLFGRLDGPLHFRFILQPTMALIFAILDGIKDAKLGKPAYFWTVLSSPEHRRELLKDGWKHFGKIFILAIILDLVYAWKVQDRIYPLETLTVALSLAVVPYVLLRGPVNRIVRLFKKKSSVTSNQ